MAQSKSDRSTGLELFRYLVVGVGLLLMAGAAVGALVAVARSGSSTGQALADGMMVLAVGEPLGIMLLGLAAMLWLLEERVQQGRQQQRSLEHLQGAIESLRESMPGAAPAAPPAAGKAAVHEERHDSPRKEITELLAELRDLSLMDDRQRREAAARHWARRKEALLKAVDRSVGLGDWGAANVKIAELKAIAPEDAEILGLEKRIAAEQAARMEGDLAAAQNQVRHAMSISAWEQADEVVAGLLKKYPGASEVREIAANVQREREAFEREHVDRLFLDLSDATEHRHWRRAVELAEEIVHRHPNDGRVDKLERDLATMRDNAAAQERKEQEELFKDLLKRQRYEEAVEVARHVMDKYPGSPAAVELMKLVPKVEDLVRAEKAKREWSTGTQ